MICEKCGTQIENGKNFCSNCGEPIGAEFSLPQNVQNNAQPKKTVVTAGGYILRSLINFIPVFGPLIYFIMLFIWNADSSKEESFRNWAKSQLILAIIALGIVLLVAIIAIVIILLFIPTRENMVELAVAPKVALY